MQVGLHHSARDMLGCLRSTGYHEGWIVTRKLASLLWTYRIQSPKVPGAIKEGHRLDPI